MTWTGEQFLADEQAMAFAKELRPEFDMPQAIDFVRRVFDYGWEMRKRDQYRTVIGFDMARPGSDLSAVAVSRLHRDGQRRAVNVIVQGMNAEKVLQQLREKAELQAMISGDRWTDEEWRTMHESPGYGCMNEDICGPYSDLTTGNVVEHSEYDHHRMDDDGAPTKKEDDGKKAVDFSAITAALSGR